MDSSSLKLNNRDKRAVNRVRKRNNELMLFNSKHDEIEECEYEIKKKKENEHEQCETGQNCQGPSTSKALIVADSLLEQAKALSRELRTKILERNNTPNGREVIKTILQLHKLQGRLLSEREIAAFLHRMMLGVHNAQRTGSNWIRFEGGKKPLQIVLLRVNCQDADMLNTQANANFIDQYFNQKWIRLHPTVRDRDNFWKTISTVSQSRQELLIRKIKKNGDPLLTMRLSERKTQLLMSMEQMVDAKFPFPTDIFLNDGEKKTNEPRIQPTRKIYRRVNEFSPIFIIDCEMCLTSVDRLELTRISMLNEQGEILMDELVKPYNKIIDYITHKSGITEQMLKNVHTRLNDIQSKFCDILTDDAILCGHSLENDLHALQLSHPFCIDTSLLFNFSGRSYIRSGLKALAKIFLNEDIQESAHGQGHCSIQDARTTLKLLQLKLAKGIQFGNVILGWNFSEWAKQNGMTITGTRINEITGQIEEQYQEVKECASFNEGRATSGPVFLSDEQNQTNFAITNDNNTNSCNQLNAQEENYTHIGQTDLLIKASVDKNEGYFDFTEALRIDNAMQKNVQLSDCFRILHEGKKPKKVLIAIPHATRFFNSNACCTVYDLFASESATANRSSNSNPHMDSSKMKIPLEQQSAVNKLHVICSNLSPKIINYDFVFIEINCPNGTPKRDLDAAFEELIKGVCNNAMMLCIISAGTISDKKNAAILYHKIHTKQR